MNNNNEQKHPATFFANPNPFTSEDLVMNLDLFSIMKLLEVGKILIVETQDSLDAYKKKILDRNYIALNGAYKIAMT